MSDTDSLGSVVSRRDDPGPVIIEIDWTGVIVRAGGGLATLLGCPPAPDAGDDPLVGRSLYDLLIPGDRTALHALLGASGQQLGSAWSVLLAGRRDDGLPLVIEASIPERTSRADGTTLVLTRWGGPVGWTADGALDPPPRSGPDHVLSHDVRATVRNARNFVNLFARKLAASDPPATELPSSHLDTALRALATGDEALNQIVWFMRLEADPLTMQAVPLATLIEMARRQAVSDLAKLASGAGQDDLAAPLEVNLRSGATAAAGFEIIGNLELLIWLFSEVFVNARKFGGPEATISVGATRQGPVVEVQVGNTGRAIDPTLAEAAFELGRMLQARGERPGVGLGLPLCRRIVTRHGGRIAFAAPGGDPVALSTLEIGLLGPA